MTVGVVWGSETSNGRSSIIENLKKTNLTSRAISGVKDCGAGVASSVALCLEDDGGSICDSAPCTLNRGQQINASIDFTPSERHPQLTLRTVLVQEAQLMALHDDVRVPDSAVNPGTIYTLNFSFQVPAFGLRGSSELRIKLYESYV